MKKTFLVVLTCFFVLISLCSCKNPIANNDFVEGSLLFDIGADSIDSVGWCKIKDYDTGNDIFIDEKDIRLFEKYKYKGDPGDKLHLLFLFPTTKRIDICIYGETFTLSLMEDGDIGVRISEEKGFKLYEADEKHKITPEKFERLVNKYIY